MRNNLPFISPWPLATTAEKVSRNSLTIAPAAILAGDGIAVAHLANELECCAQSSKQRSRRGICRFSFCRSFPFFAQVEGIPGRLRALHSPPRPLTDRAICQARWNHERLLRAADDYVNCPAIHIKLSRAETGDGIDHQECVICRSY